MNNTNGNHIWKDRKKLQPSLGPVNQICVDELGGLGAMLHLLMLEAERGGLAVGSSPGLVFPRLQGQKIEVTRTSMEFS